MPIMSTPTTQSNALRPGFKPREVEELIDYYFHRPLASLIVRLLMPLPVTPNQVTVLSAATGAVSGMVMSVAIWRSAWWFAAGSGVLLLSVLLDCADGQLARMRNQMSPGGRILDGVLDGFAIVSAFHAFAFYLLLAKGYPFFAIWPIGAVTGWSLLRHTSQYDGVKNLYLHCSRPDFSLGGKTLLNVDDIDVWKRESAEQRDWFRVLLMRIWISWTRSQRKTLQAWYGDLSPRTAEERDLYRSMYQGYMRAWTFLGLGTHMFVLELAALLTPLWPDVLWVAWGIIVGPLNLLYGLVVWQRGRLERAWRVRLGELRAAS